MSNLTYRIVNDADGIAAWIDVNDKPSVYQPHHPEGTAAWASETEAETWAVEHVAKLTALEEERVLRDSHISRILKAMTEQGAEAVLAKIEATE